MSTERELVVKDNVKENSTNLILRDNLNQELIDEKSKSSRISSNNNIFTIQEIKGNMNNIKNSKFSYNRSEYLEKTNYFNENENNNNTESKSKKVKLKKQFQFYIFKDTLLCCFCGGNSCKHENYLNHPKPYIIGLNSDLIEYNLIASQRISTVLIEKYDLINSFKNKNIGLIVNLQREGEHPYCGPNGKLENSGFSYNPQDFQSHGIEVLLCGWKDLDIPDSMLHMMNIVKKMYYYIYELNQSVFVHCHAGYGRTGIVLACFLIFSTMNETKNVVQHIRSIRSKCIEKSSQYEYCKLFEEYFKNSISIFREPISMRKYDDKIHYLNDINFFIDNQLNIPYFQNKKYYVSIYRNVPFLLVEIFNLLKGISYEKLSIILNEENENKGYLILLMLLSHYDWSGLNESSLIMLKSRINMGKWEFIHSKLDERILIELLFDWMFDSTLHIIESSKIIRMLDNKFACNPIISLEIMNNFNFKIMRNNSSKTINKSDLLNRWAKFFNFQNCLIFDKSTYNSVVNVKKRSSKNLKNVVNTLVDESKNYKQSNSKENSKSFKSTSEKKQIFVSSESIKNDNNDKNNNIDKTTNKLDTRISISIFDLIRHYLNYVEIETIIFVAKSLASFYTYTPNSQDFKFNEDEEFFHLDRESYVFLSFIEKISFALLSFDKEDYHKYSLFNKLSITDMKYSRINAAIKIRIEKKNATKENPSLLSVYVLMQIILLYYEDESFKLNDNDSLEKKSSLNNLKDDDIDHNNNDKNNTEKIKVDFSKSFFNKGKDSVLNNKNHSLKFIDNNKLNEDIISKEKELKEIKDSIDKYFENSKKKDLIARKIEVDTLLPLLVSYNNEIKKNNSK